MKKLITLISLIYFCIQPYSQKDHLCSKVKSQTFNKSATLNLSQIAETEKYNVHYYQLDISMTNISTQVSGTGLIKASANENLDSALFELHNNFSITEIRVNGNPVSYSRNNSAITVPVNATLGSLFIIETDYNGTPPGSGSNPFGNAGMSAGSSPSWGNHVVWSLSEPFSAYEWFPCKQSLTDKADSSALNITVPDTCMAGSNGILEDTISLGNGFKTFKWKHRHPIDYYLISVAIAKYVEYSIYANPVGAPNPILIQNFIYDNPNTLPNFQADINETVDFLELFYEKYGPYPFEDEKYGHCMAPFSGGMEHQTMTSQGWFEKGLTAHELGHQWWGDNVTCASWSDIWINEGFASYSEYLMLENLYQNETASHMNDIHQDVMSQPGGSIWVLDSLNTNKIFNGRLTYNKGSAIIHSIRYLVNNDSLFFNCLKTFQNNYGDSVARGIDFRNMLLSETGIDFTTFFEQWYFGQGYPTYSIKWKQQGNDVLLELSHTASKANVTPTFTNPIELKFIRQGIGDTIIRFDISSNLQQFLIPNIGTLMSTIYVDPNNWIINEIGSVQEDNSLVSLKEEAPEPSFSIYPNPSTGKFFVENNSDKKSILSIYQMNGKKIFEKHFIKNTLVNIEKQKRGTYLFVIETDKKIKRLKVVNF